MTALGQAAVGAAGPETAPWRAAPFRDAGLMLVDLEVRREAEGAMVMRSRIPWPHDWNLPRAFAAVAAREGAKTALARREPARWGGDWGLQSYAELKASMDAVTQWLLDHPQHTGGPLMVMGANSPVMAAFLFGALAAGVPTAPVSAHYALLGGDLGRLDHVIRSLKPSILLIEDARMAAAAIDALDLGEAVVITATPEALTADEPALDGGHGHAPRSRRGREHRGSEAGTGRPVHDDLRLDGPAQGRAAEPALHRRQYGPGGPGDRRGLPPGPATCWAGCRGTRPGRRC